MPAPHALSALLALPRAAATMPVRMFLHHRVHKCLALLAADDLTSSREISPPRQRKPPAAAAVAGTERKFSWATQRITELTHDLDKATKRAKVRQLYLWFLAGGTARDSPHNHALALQ